MAFFRINDPYRFIGIFLLIIAIRIPFFLGDLPLTIPELEWLVIGESISFNKMLYLDVWDDVAPFSAMVYSIIDALFGRSQWAYVILAMTLVFSQCFLFNQLLITNKAYKENTYIPALVYAILMGAFFDFFTLSPVLLSGLFMLAVVNGIFHHIAYKSKDERFLNMGLALGISILFFLPSLIYLPVVLVTLGLYSNMDLKKYLLLFFGLLFPLVLVGIFFFWYGALWEFVDQYFISWVSLPVRQLVSGKFLLLLAVPTAVLLVLAWLNIYTGTRYSNQQTSFLLVMMWFFIGSGVIIFLVKDRAPHQMMVFVMPAAFFISHLFLLIRRRFLAEVFFLLFFGITLLVSLGTLKGFVASERWFQYDKLLVTETPWDEMVNEKKVLIIGEDLNAYNHAKLSTPYLNWNLARHHLNQLESYDNLSVVFENFSEEMPEVIIDQKGVVPVMFQYMPTIGAKYRQSTSGDAYILID